LIVEDGFGVRVLERAYRHYAKDMTQCIKCQASCAVSPRVAPRRVRALRNWLMAQLRQSLLSRQHAKYSDYPAVLSRDRSGGESTAFVTRSESKTGWLSAGCQAKGCRKRPLLCGG
jgi:hypothetical protein